MLALHPLDVALAFIAAVVFVGLVAAVVGGGR